MKDIARLSTSDWAVLALLTEGEAHGFRLAAVFAPSGELGGIWKVQRPQVYRALEHLVRQKMAREVRREAGEAGPPRTLYAATARGRKAVEGWLNTPVVRLRYGRSDLRLKIAFLLRSGNSLNPLLESQAEVYCRIQRELEEQLPQSQGIERVSVMWRLEMAKAGLRFVEGLLT